MIMRSALGGVDFAYEALATMYCRGPFVDKDPDISDAWSIIAVEEVDLYSRTKRFLPYCGPKPEDDPARAQLIRDRAKALRLAYDLPSRLKGLTDVPKGF